MKSETKGTAVTIGKNVAVIFLLLLSMILGLVGCTNRPSESGEIISGDAAGNENATAEEPVIIRLAGEDVGLPNPFRHTAGGAGVSKATLLYDTLLEKDENQDIPWLAKRWEMNEDGTSFTFFLHENALWHDGEPLTAEDVVFTFNYYKEHPPVSNSLTDGKKYIVTDTKAIDDHTVEITLNSYNNTYLSKIGSVLILPKHIWENVDDPTTFDGNGATVGSGPYKMEIYNPEQGAYRFVAFEQYYGLQPAVAAIEWVPVSDEVLAFDNEEIDLVMPTADLVSRYKESDEYIVEEVPAYRNSYRLMMNMETVPELCAVDLRKAIAYAVNRQEIIEKIGRGVGLISSMGYVPSSSPWYNSDIEQYDYNPEKAKALLEGRTYSFTLLTDNSAKSTKMAELIKISLDEVGIDVTVESVESKARDNALKTGTYELLLTHAGGMGGDPDYLRGIYGEKSTTIKGWSNERVNELAKAQAIERDETNRKEMLFELQKIIADEVPMVMLYSTVTYFVYRPEKYDGWMMIRYDHNQRCDFYKLSYVVRN